MNADSKLASANTRINGRYANYFKVGYNAFEFVLEFGQSQEGVMQESIHSRIVTAPAYAKALMKTLGESITRYEKDFGTIRYDYEGIE